jgi:hypothetical protein
MTDTNTNYLPLTQIVSTGVLIVAMFGFWWNSADPKSRLDKVEASILENRKEFIEADAKLRAELDGSYLKIREHRDFVERVEKEINQLEAESKLRLSQTEFKAWKEERDHIITLIEAEINRKASQQQLEEQRARIEKLYALIEKLLDWQRQSQTKPNQCWIKPPKREKPNPPESPMYWPITLLINGRVPR